MAEKKESYSEEELNEMIVWFNNHADELPKEMQINKSAFTPDLKLTVESCKPRNVWATIRWPELLDYFNKSKRRLRIINKISYFTFFRISSGPVTGNRLISAY